MKIWFDTEFIEDGKTMLRMAVGMIAGSQVMLAHDMSAANDASNPFSASINTDGEIVGINTAVVTEATVADSGEGGSFTGGSARIRPVHAGPSSQTGCTPRAPVTVSW